MKDLLASIAACAICGTATVALSTTTHAAFVSGWICSAVFLCLSVKVSEK